MIAGGGGSGYRIGKGGATDRPVQGWTPPDGIDVPRKSNPVTDSPARLCRKVCEDGSIHFRGWA